MTVYVDVILFYNFLIDYMLLWSTAHIFKLRPKWYRIAAGAFIGAAYTIVIFFPDLSGYFTFFSKVILSALMVFTVFGYYRFHIFIRRLLIFYLVAFAIGGGLLGVNYLLRTDSEILSGMAVTHSGGFGQPVTWLFLLVGFPCLWWLSGKGVDQMKQSSQKSSLYVELTIELLGETITCRGLLDTGNQLYEPVTRVPVTIADVDLFSHLLPVNLYKSIKQRMDYSADTSYLDVQDEWLQRVRLIPFRSVSRGMDLLLAVRPDKISISMNGKIFITNRALIGLNPVPLASDGSYQAIVHPRLTDDQYLVRNETGRTKEAI